MLSPPSPSWWPLTSPSNLTHSPLVDSLLPTQVHFPIYHFHRDDVVPGVSDAALSLIAPFVAYWLVSLFFHLVDVLQLPYFESRRIHEPEEVTKRNRVTPGEVVKAVLLQQAIQTGLGLVYLAETEKGRVEGTDFREEMRPYAETVVRAAFVVLGQKRATWALARAGRQLTQWLYWWGVPFLQLVWASFVMDTWQYFWHRAFHVNKFLYRNLHSVHHRLYVPYAYGALYNHPIEGLILDSGGAVVAHALSFMTTRQAIVLFAVSTAKTVDDHCGYKLPWDPFQFLFLNNADYHDIHHQQFGIKRNFSQPYYINWDLLLGTHMSRAEAQRFRLKKRGLANGHASPLSNGSVTPIGNGTATPNGAAILNGAVQEGEKLMTADGVVPHTDERDPLVRKRRAAGAADEVEN